jgi:hypothetical protein
VAAGRISESEEGVRPTLSDGPKDGDVGEDRQRIVSRARGRAEVEARSGAKGGGHGGLCCVVPAVGRSRPFLGKGEVCRVSEGREGGGGGSNRQPEVTASRSDKDAHSQ